MAMGVALGYFNPDMGVLINNTGRSSTNIPIAIGLFSLINIHH
jgi:ACR3 family arsenite efflux pump ArsB